MKSVFISPLAGRFNEFVEMKRSIGYKYEGDVYRLKQLDRICAESGEDNSYLSKEIVTAWIEKRPNESDVNRQRRVKLSNEIAAFLILRGEEAYIIPSCNCHFRKPPAYVPYIFTKEQVEMILKTTDSQPAHRKHPISNIKYSVLFRLLYCCGLRISEALKLTYNDVNLKTGTLMLRESKFGKDRLVPMAESLNGLIVKYIPLVQVHYPDNPHLFPSRFSFGSVSTNSVYGYFRKILWEAGIPHGGRGKGPRLHDFRHTFSVHSLQKWISDGVDVYTALPILAVYLGHDDIRLTEKYLRLTSEVFPEMQRIAEDYAGGVIPEVSFVEAD